MLKKNLGLFLLIYVTFLGFILRLSFFKAGTFPLHDGGYFYVLVKDLINNNFIPPIYSTYNNANIPFIYPPMGIYIVGFIESITGADRLLLFKIIPLIFTTFTIPAFYFLSLQIFKNKISSLAATIVFSLLPMSYAWLILGGGVTRALGSLLSILALAFVIRFINSGKWQDGILAIVLNGCTILSHPEYAWFLFYSVGLLCAIKLIARERRVILRAIILIVGTIILVFPWLIVILVRHGWDVFLPLLDNGFSRVEEITKFFLLLWSREPFFPVFTLFAFVGLFLSVKKNNWFIVLWLPLVFFLQGRASDQRAVIPLALLAGVGIKTIIYYVKPYLNTKKRELVFGIGIIIIFLYSLVGSYIVVSPTAKPLSKDFLSGIEWIHNEMPMDASFAVISQEDWPGDYNSEWIIALTGRKSVSVVQGYEWLPGFSDRILKYDQLQLEYSKGINDLMIWMNENNIWADYLVFPKSDQTDVQNLSMLDLVHRDDVVLHPGVLVMFENDSILILKLSHD